MARLVLFKGQWEELAVLARYDANVLARMCEVSPRQLQRYFRRIFNCCPQRWLDKKRIGVAQRRLLAGETIKKGALRLGFKQVSHFCRHFKSLCHMTASEFTAAGILSPNVAH